jgi:hypothetical protein
VVALGSRALSQQTFGFPQMAACLPQQHSELAVDLLWLLQFVQERADRLGPLAVFAEVANVLSSAASPAQFEVRPTLLSVFGSHKPLSR